MAVTVLFMNSLEPKNLSCLSQLSFQNLARDMKYYGGEKGKEKNERERKVLTPPF